MRKYENKQSNERVRPAWNDLVRLLLLACVLLISGVLLNWLGRIYLLAFCANVAMAAFCLTLAAIRRWRDWHVLPLTVLFAWIVAFEALGFLLLLLGNIDTPVYAWLAEAPLFVPTVLGFTAVVYLWRVFELHGEMKERQEALREHERRMRERIQYGQKLESLGTLAGGIAHRYNNLLTTILGNVALARYEVSADSPIANCLEEIENAADRAAKISKQMLDYSGCGRFSIKRIDLAELVEGIRALIQSGVSSGTEIRLDVAPSCPRISGDPSQLRQVILSLVANAAEAQPRGKGTIIVSIQPVTPGSDTLSSGAIAEQLPLGAYVRLSVIDDGKGMDEEVVRNAFDPFFSTKEEGRGLGLAAVLGIVRGHHGTVQIHSTPGKGTRVDVYIPVEKADVAALPENRNSTD